MCYIGYTIAYPSDYIIAVNICAYLINPLMPAGVLGKTIPGRITKPLTRLYVVVRPDHQADITRGRSTPDRPQPCDNHIPGLDYILW